MSGTIAQQGSLNTTALTVPGVLVQIQQPSAQVVGVPTNVMGVVGTAVWGPVAQPAICSGQNDFTAQFGPLQNAKYDAGTVVAVAQVIGGASQFRAVRVTDGTDTEATYTLPAAALAASPGFFAVLSLALNEGSGVSRGASNIVVFSPVAGLFVARYTGSLGNSVRVAIGPGSKAGTFRAVVGLVAPNMPQVSEVYDNLVNGAGETIAPATYALSGGTSGAAEVTSQMLVGSDIVPRSGMYALRGQRCSVAVLADSDDSTTWTTQAAFGLSEGISMVISGPSGDSIQDAIAAKAAAGLDTYGVKLMLGDYAYVLDQTNDLQRPVATSGIVAGRLAALAPNQSSLNKPLLGIVGTQKQGQPGTGQANTYSSAELQALFQAGIDVVGNPSPGGRYFSVLRGCNASSNSAVNGDNYTRMINFLASSLAGPGGLGQFIGLPIYGTGFFNEVTSALLSFLFTVYQQGMLPAYGSGLPYAVQCSDPTVSGTDNPQSRVSQGYVQADVQVRLQAITLFLVANLIAGQTVTVTSTASAS